MQHSKIDSLFGVSLTATHSQSVFKLTLSCGISLTPTRTPPCLVLWSSFALSLRCIVKSFINRAWSDTSLVSHVSVKQITLTLSSIVKQLANKILLFKSIKLRTLFNSILRVVSFGSHSLLGVSRSMLIHILFSSFWSVKFLTRNFLGSVPAIISSRLFSSKF